jgi:two-component system CheB/CheR fusion protein
MSGLPPIVGIGASAGGLEALKELVQAVPNDSGIAFVVVQHLAPDQPSLMDKLLGDHTPVPVKRIEDGAEIRPDHIYIIPPGPFLEIEDGRFRLIEHEREAGVRTPIDRFFTSLAEAAGRLAFAVVLSGTGSDGTMGVRAIKTNGGVALVQDSGNARFPGMPDSAAATGLVDFILRADEIPGRILDIVGHRAELEEILGRDALLGEIEKRLDEIIDPLEDDVGNSFSGYKPGTLVRRVARRMTLLRQSSVDGYLKLLAQRDEERRLLAQDFLIGVTQFFRDPESFDAVRTRVLQTLMASDAQSFRIWTPGCSTGEEAYSLGILLLELAEETGDQRSWKIFGTDIDQEALRHARAGRYPEASLKGMSERRRNGFFHGSEGFWHVDARLREMCVFAPHNLLQDPPFSKLDLISCRNVMIYLSADSQEALLPRFHYALNPGGYLWLGPSETVGKGDRFFRTDDRQARIYRRDDRASPGYSALGQIRPRSRAAPLMGGGFTLPKEAAKQPKGDVASVSEEAFLRSEAPAFATINRQDDVIYVSDGMSAFVKPSRGATSIALDDFLASELRLPVHSALDEARETGMQAEVRNVVVEAGGPQRLFDVRISPVPDESDLMLLALREVRPAEEGDLGGAGEVRRQEGHERDLLLTRKRLATVEREFETAEQELRSANEELLSMNEELQSSNEELETSREELQSINEELETVNAELSENNRQLVRANSDLKNLLESTDIATLFIDQNDCVRLYTPELRKLFGVQERDIGRPIHDLASKVDYPQLTEDAEKVRRTLRPVEREVRIEASDETFATWVRPYRTVDNRLDGVVVTFVDVTERKRNEQQLERNATTLREQYAELEQLYDTPPVGLSLVDRDLRYLRINRTLADINGYPMEEHIGRLQEEMLPEAHAQVSEIQRRVLETGEPALGLTVQTVTPKAKDEVRDFIVDFYPVRDGDTVFAVGSCVREVTRERQLERDLAAGAARRQVAVDAAGLGVFEWFMAEDRTIWENDRMYEIFGRRPEDGPLSFEEFGDAVLHPDDLEPMKAAIEAAMRTGDFDTTARIRHADGSWRHIQYYGRIEEADDEGKGRLIGVVADVTELQEARERDLAERSRLQRLLDSLSSFVGLMDPDGTLLEANAPALQAGGLTSDEVIGRKLWDTSWWSFNAESRNRLKDAIARAANGETVRYDVPVRMAGDEMVTIDFQLAPIVGEDGVVREIVPSGIDITERVRAEERKDILLAELEHRVKNTLATVQAVARFSRRWAKDKEDMARSLSDRLAAIARTHDAMTASDWEGEQLRTLLRNELSPYIEVEGGRLQYDGDDLLLTPGNALPVGLAIHELATNAIKHGALTNDHGRIVVTVKANGNELQRFEWREVDGPSVAQPEEEGFGMFLIGTLLERELKASATVEFAVSGVRCVIERE